MVRRGSAGTIASVDRVRYERAEPLSPISFPPGPDNRCGSPSPLRAEPRHLLEALPLAGSYHLAEGEPLALRDLSLTMLLEPLPTPNAFRRRQPHARTRPSIRVAVGGAEEGTSTVRQLPAVLRAGETIAWITRAPGSDPTIVAVETYSAVCEPVVRAPLPDKPTLLWLGTAGHTQVLLGEEGGDRAHVQLLREDDGPPRVLVSSVSEEHGSRSLTFTANVDATPIAVDTGVATIIGNWQIAVGAEATAAEGETSPPQWYAVAIPYIPHGPDPTPSDPR